MKQKDKEKEQAEKIKALRRELEEKLEEQLLESLQGDSPQEKGQVLQPVPFSGTVPLETAVMDEKMQVEVRRLDENQMLEPAQAKKIIEALLFAATKPLTVPEIRKAVKPLTAREAEAIIAELKEEYLQQGRSFEIIEIAGGYEMATRKEYAPWILKIELQKKAKQVTQSALETLAILAYKQPVTRAEIEDLRGVDVSGVMATLVERNLIKIVGRKEVPGRPFLYGTTEKFLEHFGLNRIEDLPPISDIQSLVEKSVRKEDLLGVQKNVPIPAEENSVISTGEARRNPEDTGSLAAEDAARDDVDAQDETESAAETEPGA